MVMNLIIAATFLLLSASMFLVTGGFAPPRSGDVGPAYWPRIILGALFVLSVILLVRVIVYPPSPESANPPEKQPHPRNFWFVLGSTVAYIAAMGWIGFTIATVLYLGVMLWLLQFRRIIPFLMIVLGSTLVTVLLFTRLLGIPLPRGTGLFRTISLFFY